MVLIHTVVNVLMVLTVNIVITTSMIVPLLRVSMVVLVMIWCPISIVNVLQDLLVKNVKRISMSAFQCLVNQVGNFLHFYLLNCLKKVCLYVNQLAERWLCKLYGKLYQVIFLSSKDIEDQRFWYSHINLSGNFFHMMPFFIVH